MRSRSFHLVDVLAYSVLNELKKIHFGHVFDVGAGQSSWVRTFFQGKVTTFDIDPGKEPDFLWDFNSPFRFSLPSKPDLICAINSIHYSKNPILTLENLVDVLENGGSMVITLPWLYPPHDITQAQYRITAGSILTIPGNFESIDVIEIGNLFWLPAIFLSRLSGKKNSNPSPFFLNRINRFRKKTRPAGGYFGPLWFVVIFRGKNNV